MEETNNVNGEIVVRQIRCENLCLPYTNHCAEHIGYNVDQKLFRYCAISVCGRPVLSVDALHTGGLCIEHFERTKSMSERKHVEMPSCVSIGSVRYPNVVGMGQGPSSAHFANMCPPPTQILPPLVPPNVPLPASQHHAFYPHEQSIMHNGPTENSNENSNGKALKRFLVKKHFSSRRRRFTCFGGQ